MVDAGLTTLYETRFSTLLMLNLQQKTSKLRGRVMEKSETGAKMVSPIQFNSAIQSKVITGRFNPIEAVPTAYTRRWVTPIDKGLPQLVDTFEQLKTQIDPKSNLVSAASAAFARDWDDEIIRAATAASTIGTDAGSLTTEAFDTTNFQIAADFGASASVGLTVAKLNEARRILEHYHVDLDAEQATLVIGSNQHADLRNQAQVTNADFNQQGGVLENGMVRRYMGFDIVVSERLPILTDKDSDTTTRGCLVFVKSGIHMNFWQDIKTQINQRHDLEGLPWQVYSLHSFGATRTELGRVIQVCAADSTGADITP